MRFSLPKTSDYHMSAYGEDVAHSMACAWVDRMCHFFDSWCGAGMPEVMEWGQVLAEYREPAAVSELAEGASRQL